MFKFKNSKKQGDYGVGIAISYFTQMGYHLSIPLTDSQEYDLIVDINGELHKVQVKTTSYKTVTGMFQASLSTKGGNRSTNTVKKFDNSVVDMLFIVTSDDSAYLIPTKDINITSNITLGTKYDSFRIT